jgi:hypothetical protein
MTDKKIHRQSLGQVENEKLPPCDSVNEKSQSRKMGANVSKREKASGITEKVTEHLKSLQFSQGWGFGVTVTPSGWQAYIEEESHFVTPDTLESCSWVTS